MPLLLGLGQTFVIIAGGIDLSVGFVMGLAAVIMARAMQTADARSTRRLALAAGLVAGVAGGAACPGSINGPLISRLRVPPFIGTLGMYGVARGAAFLPPAAPPCRSTTRCCSRASATASSSACPIRS